MPPLIPNKSNNFLNGDPKTSVDATDGFSKDQNRSGTHLNQIVSSSDIQGAGGQQMYQSREQLEVIIENPRMEESQILDNQGTPFVDLTNR